MKLSNLRKTLLASAAGLIMALGVSASASAAPVPTFTLNPGAFASVPDTFAPFTADHVSGVSSELLYVTPAGNTGSGWLQIQGFKNGPTLLRDSVTGLGNYALYLTYDLQDVANGDGTNTLSKLDFKFLVDVNADTTFVQADVTAAGGVEAQVTGVTSDDIVLAYGGLVQGVAGVNVLNGAFLNSIQTFVVCNGNGSGTLEGVTPTGALGARQSECTSNLGSQFFQLPNPFFGLAFDEFNNTTQGLSFDPAFPGLIAITQATGSFDFNRIPEPGSLALLGLGLLGAGFNARRRRSN